MHKTRLLKGTRLLTGIGLICAFLEVIYRIGLQNMAGADGMAYLQPSHVVYMLMWLIGTVGLPMPIAHMVSSRIAKGDRRGAQSIFLIAVIAIGAIGLVMSALVWGLSKTLASEVGLRDAWVLLQWTAPCFLLYGIIGAFRGYFQGVSLTILSNASMLLDQLIRVIVAMLMVSIWKNKEMIDQLSGAVIGMNVGAVAAVLMLGTLYLLGVDQMQSMETILVQTKIKSKGKIAARILKKSSMTVIGMGFFAFCLLFDTCMSMNRFAPQSEAETLSAVTKYGLYNGMAMPVVFFGIVLAVVFFFAASARLHRTPPKFHQQTVRVLSDALLKKMLLFGSIGAVLLWVLPDGIMHLIYMAGADENEMALLVSIIRILSLTAFFAPLAQAALMMMQEIGYEIVAIVLTVFAVLLKVLIFYIVTPLVYEPILGIAFSTTISFAALGVLSLVYLVQAAKTEMYISRLLPKIVLSAAGAGVVVYFTNRFLLSKMLGLTGGTIVALLLGIILYLLFNVLMNVIRIQDFLPTQKEQTTEA